MKSHKEILEECIDEFGWYESDGAIDCDANQVHKAIETAAKQAFDAGYVSGYLSHVVAPKYRTFEDYLKDLDDEDVSK